MRRYPDVLFIGTFLISVISLPLYFLGEHGDFVLFLNRNRTETLDFIMPYITHLGDGLFFAICCVILLIIRWRDGITLTILGLLHLLVTSVLKRVIFRDIPRPKKYFADKVELDFLEGVSVHGNFSFPSGHTMTAFVLATFIALTFRNRALSIILFVYAILVGLSRIYLLQHFLIDVIIGAFIGSGLSFIFYQQFFNFSNRRKIR